MKENLVVTFLDTETDSDLINTLHLVPYSAIAIDSDLDDAAIEVYATSPENQFDAILIGSITLADGFVAFDDATVAVLRAQRQLQFKRSGSTDTVRFMLQLGN